MLSLINEVGATAADVHGVPTYIKVHCATVGDTSFDDPQNPGTPLDFNFLPIIADPRVGVNTHTVQASSGVFRGLLVLLSMPIHVYRSF